MAKKKVTLTELNVDLSSLSEDQLNLLVQKCEETVKEKKLSNIDCVKIQKLYNKFMEKYKENETSFNFQILLPINFTVKLEKNLHALAYDENLYLIDFQGEIDKSSNLNKLQKKYLNEQIDNFCLEACDAGIESLYPKDVADKIKDLNSLKDELNRMFEDAGVLYWDIKDSLNG